MNGAGRGRGVRTVMAALPGLAATVALTASGCSQLTPPPQPLSRTTLERPAAAHRCTVSPTPARVLALPRVDAETVRVAADVVGEKLTWRAGSRTAVAWVGVDALGIFQDLDLVPMPLRGRTMSRAWRSHVRPGLVVVQGNTRRAAPCDLLFLSTEGVRRGAAVRAVEKLRVTSTPSGPGTGGGGG